MLDEAKNQTNKRNSSIELLRIISMLMIVFHHFAIHGGFKWTNTSVTIPHLWYNFIVMGGKIGANVFILISGYYLINNKDKIINIKKILKFWGQVFFYSVIIYVVFNLTGITKFHINDIVYVLFPITFAIWWFPSTYFVLYLIHPFLNKLLHSIDKKTYQNLLILLVICWSVIPTLTTSPFDSNNLLWFITLYAIAGYVRIYGFNPKFTFKHYFTFWLIFSLCTYFSSVIFTILGTKWSIFNSFITYFYGQATISALSVSLTLFMTFATLKMKYHKWINIIASASFGVYLIHDHVYVNPYLWLKIFKNAQYQDSIMLIPYSIVVVIIVYVICTIIDLIRQKTIEKLYIMVINKYSESVIKPLKKMINSFKTSILE